MSTVKKGKAKAKSTEKFPGYPHYPKKQDIYSKEKEEADIDPENTSAKKKKNVKPQTLNEKNFEDDQTAGDLDIPGTDEIEDLNITDLEDEENDYYSLGGDDHNDLEES